MSCARVCILTSKKQLVNHGSIEVCWRNNKFEICIKEDGEWCPPFSDSVKDFNNNNMGDIDIESEEWFNEDGRNNSDDSSFIEDTGSERDVEEETYGDPLLNKERCSGKDVSDSKAYENMEKVDLMIEAGESNEHEKSSTNNEDSLQSVAETNFEVNDDVNVQEFTGGIFGNVFNEIGSEEMKGSRDYSIRAKSDGFASPNEIPDLNNPIPYSEPIKKIKSSHMTPGKRAFRRNSTELSSSSSEIAKTMQVGVSIGYQMEGSEQVIEDILKGEGDKLNSK
ncbi:hypothetical protein L2E82_12695 [Cichorium intybus]|uniref:Uncharacterized protein n=1 Tax=Cichorium intybus TaxID=13427 RepID=A0ACB9GGX8_CICIN|nr:hypothetical protein L2E82_12695 [Cichorium intybus]